MNIDAAQDLIKQKTQQVQEGAQGLVGDAQETFREQQQKISEAQATAVQMKNDAQTQIQQTTAQAKQNFDNYKERNAMMLANSEDGGVTEGLEGLKEMGNNAYEQAGKIKDGLKQAGEEGKKAATEAYNENVNIYSQTDDGNNQGGNQGGNGRRRRKKRRKSKRWPRKKSKSKKSRKRRKKKGGRKSRKKKKRRSRKKSRRRRRR